MKSFLLFIGLILFTGTAWGEQGSEGGNGGDEVALEFLGALQSALTNIKLESPDLEKIVSPLLLESVARGARTVVTEKCLLAGYQGILQLSVAVNDPKRNLIVINRARWQGITDQRLREAIALHEVLSLVGMENTGNYEISSRYALGRRSLPALTASVAPELLDSIVVPVPHEIQDSSSIIVSVPPSADDEKQEMWILICHYSLTSKGMPAFQSAHSCTAHAPNQKLSLPAGEYALSLRRAQWSRQVTFFTLGKNEQKVIPLVKMEVPKIDGSYSFRLFSDLTDEAEQEKINRALWIQTLPYTLFNFEDELPFNKGYVCQRIKERNGGTRLAKVCEAIKSDQYQRLGGSYLRYLPDGSIDPLTFMADTDKMTFSFDFRSVNFPQAILQKMMVAFGADGSSIYVLPGTYTVTFTSSGGHTTEMRKVILK